MGRLIHREDEEEFAELRGEARPLTRLIVFGVLVVALIGGCVTVTQGWYRRQIDPPGEPGDKVTIVVEKGTTVIGMTSLLADKGVISNANVFRFWVRDKKIDVEAGTYVFREDSSFDETLKTIAEGPLPVPSTQLTIAEGLTMRHIRDVIVRTLPRITPEQVDAALLDPGIRSKFQPPEQTSLEGMLYPASYDIGDGEDAASVVRRMVTQTDVVADEHDLAAGAERLGLTPYQVIVVASLIQAEAGNPEEMPKIARVIYNRLAAGTPLGIDATSRYLADLMNAPVDFEADSPYNTRRSVGLPPSPIAAAGEPSLEAALAPADGPWIYYVLEEPNRHFFTDSVAEFEQKKAECVEKDLGCG